MHFENRTVSWVLPYRYQIAELFLSRPVSWTGLVVHQSGQNHIAERKRARLHSYIL